MDLRPCRQLELSGISGAMGLGRWAGLVELESPYSPSLPPDRPLTTDPRRVALGLGRILLRQRLSILWNG